MSDRELAAQGLRKGLALWPDANHWCQNTVRDTADDGTLQRCTFAIVCDGLGLGSESRWSYPRENAAYVMAESEILRVAKERGVRGAEDSICQINNHNDFATVKSIVEEAAANLEKVQ